MKLMRRALLAALIPGLLVACGSGSSTTPATGAPVATPSTPSTPDIDVELASDPAMLAPDAGYTTLPAVLYVKAPGGLHSPLTVTAPNPPSGITVESSPIGNFSGEDYIGLTIHAQPGTKPLAGLKLHVTTGTGLSTDFTFPLLVGRAFTLSNASAPSPFNAFSLSLGNNDTLWVTDYSAAYYQFTPSTHTLQRYLATGAGYSQALTADPDGSVWLTVSPLSVLHAHPQTGAPYERFDGPFYNDLRPVVLTSDNRVWFHSSGSAQIVEIPRGPSQTLSATPISTGQTGEMVPDTHGNLWGASSATVSLTKFTPGSGTATSIDLTTPKVSTLNYPVVMSGGSIYLVGSEMSGGENSTLVSYDPATGTKSSIALNGDVFSRAFAGPGNTLWGNYSVPGVTSFLAAIDPETRTIAEVPTLTQRTSDNSSSDLGPQDFGPVFDRAGNLWYVYHSSLLVEIPFGELSASALGLTDRRGAAQILQELGLAHRLN